MILPAGRNFLIYIILSQTHKRTETHVLMDVRCAEPAANLSVNASLTLARPFCKSLTSSRADGTNWGPKYHEPPRHTF